ncbi:MAG: hypothetical protein LBU88_07910, partial [Treponema sp.]|nr:hypothetical protein [Treponema sp.]
MKIKLRLSLIMVVILAVVVIGVSVLLLTRASRIAEELSFKNIRGLATETAEYWKGREDGFMRVLSTLAYQMAQYENIPEYQRRDQFDAMLRGVLEG